MLGKGGATSSRGRAHVPTANGSERELRWRDPYSHGRGRELRWSDVAPGARCISAVRSQRHQRHGLIAQNNSKNAARILGRLRPTGVKDLRPVLQGVSATDDLSSCSAVKHVQGSARSALGNYATWSNR